MNNAFSINFIFQFTLQNLDMIEERRAVYLCCFTLKERLKKSCIKTTTTIYYRYHNRYLSFKYCIYKIEKKTGKTIEHSKSVVLIRGWNIMCILVDDIKERLQRLNLISISLFLGLSTYPLQKRQPSKWAFVCIIAIV